MNLELLLLKHHGLQCIPSAIVPFGNGLVNHTWKVNAIHAQYILQQINIHVFKKPHSIDHNINLIGHYLNTCNPEYLFVQPIRDLFGNTLVEQGEAYYRLFHYVQDSKSYDVVTSTEMAYDAAQQFGLFTSLLANFDSKQLIETIPDFHNLRLRFDQFKIAIQHGNASRLLQAKEVMDQLNSYAGLIKRYEQIIAQQWRPRVIHHDTKISNVLFKNGKGYCVIDLDTVMPGLYISDVGDMMRTYLPTVSENEHDLSLLEIQHGYFEAIADGYLSKMNASLSPDELSAFFYSGQCMIFMQALRFCTDFLNNDIYYGAAFDDQNLLRSKNQLKLLREYDHQQGDFRRSVDNFTSKKSMYFTRDTKHQVK